MSWVQGWEVGTYCSAEVICRGSGMSTAQACTVLAIGHQETRAGARDVLTCADGLGRLFVVFVRGQLHPSEGEVVVVQDLIQTGRCLRDVVWCFRLALGTTIGEFCVAIRPRLLGLTVTDAELFIGSTARTVVNRMDSVAVSIEYETFGVSERLKREPATE
jgi:hypothetical protein